MSVLEKYVELWVWTSSLKLNFYKQGIAIRFLVWCKQVSKFNPYDSSRFPNSLQIWISQTRFLTDAAAFWASALKLKQSGQMVHCI